MVDDRELIKRALEGDQSAYTDLYEAHRGKVFAVLMRLAGNEENAAELTQITFISAFRELAKFRLDSSFSTWLHRIATNFYLMSCRRVRAVDDKTVSLDAEICGSDIVPDVAHGDAALESTAVRIDLSRFMALLPEGYRQVLTLHAEGYSHREIGEKLGCALHTSGSQLSKGRQFLRELMAQ